MNLSTNEKEHIVQEYVSERKLILMSEELLKDLHTQSMRVNKFQQATLWERIKMAFRGNIKWR